MGVPVHVSGAESGTKLCLECVAGDVAPVLTFGITFKIPLSSLLDELLSLQKMPEFFEGCAPDLGGDAAETTTDLRSVSNDITADGNQTTPRDVDAILRGERLDDDDQAGVQQLQAHSSDSDHTAQIGNTTPRRIEPEYGETIADRMCTRFEDLPISPSTPRFQSSEFISLPTGPQADPSPESTGSWKQYSGPYQSWTPTSTPASWSHSDSPANHVQLEVPRSEIALRNQGSESATHMTTSPSQQVSEADLAPQDEALCDELVVIRGTGRFEAPYGLGSKNALKLEKELISMLRDGEPRACDQIYDTNKIGARFNQVFYKESAKNIQLSKKLLKKWLASLANFELVRNAKGVVYARYRSQLSALSASQNVRTDPTQARSLDASSALATINEDCASAAAAKQTVLGKQPASTSSFVDAAIQDKTHINVDLQDVAQTNRSYTLTASEDSTVAVAQEDKKKGRNANIQNVKKSEPPTVGASESLCRNWITVDSLTPFTEPLNEDARKAQHLKDEVLRLLADGQPKDVNELHQRMGGRFHELFSHQKVRGAWKRWLASLPDVELVFDGSMVHKHGKHPFVRLRHCEAAKDRTSNDTPASTEPEATRISEPVESVFLDRAPEDRRGRLKTDVVDIGGAARPVADAAADAIPDSPPPGLGIASEGRFASVRTEARGVSAPLAEVRKRERIVEV